MFSRGRNNGHNVPAVRRKAVHRVAALIIASAVAITSAQAQTATELRISGAVEKLDGDLLALSLSQGISIVVRLDSEPRVNSVTKGSGSDLKAGSQVSIQAKRSQPGDLIATQITGTSHPRLAQTRVTLCHRDFRRSSGRLKGRCRYPPPCRVPRATGRYPRPDHDIRGLFPTRCR